MFFDPVHANNQLHHKFHSSGGYICGGGSPAPGTGVSQLYDKNGNRIRRKKKTRSDGELSDDTRKHSEDCFDPDTVTIEFSDPIQKPVKSIPKEPVNNPYRDFRIHACPVCKRAPKVQIHKNVSVYKKFELLATPGCECCGRGTFPAGSYGRDDRLEWLLEMYYSNIGLYLVGKCNYSWDDVAEYTDNWDWHDYYRIGDYMEGSFYDGSRIKEST